ncbi:MAG: NAD(P)H-hydrate epimerase [Treponemataceae bacterium]|nr:NAD(P)H-hydrate epimerase [Treponemataceae bacterium]
MKRLFEDTRLLDKAAREKLELSDDVMMENAAAALQSHVKGGNVLIVCGSGDNGGDGYALARRLGDCVVWSVLPAKSPSCLRQKARAEKAGVPVFEGDVSALKGEFLRESSVGGVSAAADATVGDLDQQPWNKAGFSTIVDCIFGSGFHGEPSEPIARAIRFLNELDAFKLACDVPSCLSCAGADSRDDIFWADETVTMGALKKVLYAEYSKDYVGSVFCADLGVTSSLFEGLADSSCEADSGESKVAVSLVSQAAPSFMLLEESDFSAPRREKACVHKGTYGHGAVLTGEKEGAGIIAGKACFAYGAGLVTLVREAGEEQTKGATSFASCPPELMSSTRLPGNATAAALGMGLGRGAEAERNAEARLSQLAESSISCILDADIFYLRSLPEFLEKSCGKRELVLTPHPKEFLSLLRICGLFAEDVLQETQIKSPVSYVIKKREKLSAEFCAKYPGLVLLVKGASPLISVCKYGKIRHFVNPLGKNCLAKGGSGDVLSGLVCALLAQGYPALDAALQASLAHSLASRRITTDYGMTPQMLIEAVRYL